MPEPIVDPDKINDGAPEREELRVVAAVLRSGPMTRTALTKATGVGQRKVASHISLLEQVGAVTTGPSRWG